MINLTSYDIIFRGSNIEVKARIHDNLISAIRSINEPEIKVGEVVDVFIYRIYVVQGDEVILATNRSLADEAIVI